MTILPLWKGLAKVFDFENKSTIITQDKNDNGIVEIRQEIIQSERYKKIALIYLDLDEDGDWDKMMIDYGHDGKIDIEENIQQWQ